MIYAIVDIHICVWLNSNADWILIFTKKDLGNQGITEKYSRCAVFHESLNFTLCVVHPDLKRVKGLCVCVCVFRGINSSNSIIESLS